MLLTDTPRREVQLRPLRYVDRALLGGVVLLVAWGTLAFGAVYPWAYKPLLWAAAAIGLVAFWRGRSHGPTPAATRAVVWLLGLVAAGGVLQTTPLPGHVRTAISPASESFLRRHDLGYGAELMARSAGRPAEAPPLDGRPLSIDPSSTRRGTLMLVSLATLFAGLVRLFARTGTRQVTAWLIGLGVVLAVIGIVQKAVLGDNAFDGMRIYGFWEPTYKISTPFGPYVNKNHYAGWMIMALPLALGHLLSQLHRFLRHVRPDWRSRLLALSSPHGARIQLTAFCVALMGSALALTMSRSGIGCFLVAAALAAVVGARREHSLPVRLGMIAALLLPVVAAFAWADVDVIDRFTSGSQSVELRRQAWRDAVVIIRDFPVAGTGLNTYGTATMVYSTAQTNLHFQEAHNDYLQLAAEGGLLLGIPVVLALFVAARGIRRRLADDAGAPEAYWLRFGASTALLAIALQSIVEFSLQLPGNAVFFAVLCAAALHRSPGRS